MTVYRRCFLKSAAAGSAAAVVSPGGATAASAPRVDSLPSEQSYHPQTFAVVPVVGDGKWIWKQPPSGQTGYLEPRDFNVEISMKFLGRGAGRDLQASTVFPIECAEQRLFLDSATPSGLVTQGCQAKIDDLGRGARQLLLYAPTLAKGEVVSATVRFGARLCKAYLGHKQDDFPRDQSLSAKLFDKVYLRNSPGIKVTSATVRELVKKIVPHNAHPWEKAKLFQEWVWDNVEGVPGQYTSVEAAIKNRRGDCEERATVFIALCRASGTPARQVWVPGHAWAEIGLHDGDNRPFWIPVHTAAYSWFGYLLRINT